MLPTKKWCNYTKIVLYRDHFSQWVGGEEGTRLSFALSHPYLQAPVTGYMLLQVLHPPEGVGAVPPSPPSACERFLRPLLRVPST